MRRYSLGNRMIHFFPRFYHDAEATPFGAALREIGAPYRIISANVSMHYRSRVALLLLGYPKLIWATARAARRSLFDRDAPPDAVVVSSDVEVLVFALIRLLPFAARPRIIFLPFIYTQRANPWANRARLAYYRFVVRRISRAICHSRLECDRYRALFAGCGAEFVFVPWGAYVPPAAHLHAPARQGQAEGLPVVVAAGRSGRDYRTLVAAAERLPCRVVIICNALTALADVHESERVQIVRDAFHDDYLRRLAGADIVVLPLQVDDISAGQMVLVEALSFARPLIVTRTPTIEEYVDDGDTALLVPRGDVAALEGAIRRLLDSPAEAAAMGQRGCAAYHARFSLLTHMRALIAAIGGESAGGAAQVNTNPASTGST